VIPFSEVEAALELKRLVPGTDPGGNVNGAFCSDLLSHVMANAVEGQVWFTVQSHLNIVAVALLTNITAVILTHGKSINEEAVAKAQEQGVSIYSTKLTSYEACGRLFSMLEV